jgi:hypothetical protein
VLAINPGELRQRAAHFRMIALDGADLAQSGSKPAFEKTDMTLSPTMNVSNGTSEPRTPAP